MDKIKGSVLSAKESDTYFAPALQRMLGWVSIPDLSLNGVEISTSEKRSGKEHVRTLLAGNVQLSVPIVGGNSVLKQRNLDWESLQISSHGDWQRKHLGAWQAQYGKTPYFIHLYPEMERVYQEESGGSFCRFCASLNSVAYNFLKIDELYGFAQDMKLRYPERFRQIQSHVLSQVSTDHSIFDALFRIGPDTAYLFL